MFIRTATVSLALALLAVTPASAATSGHTTHGASAIKIAAMDHCRASVSGHGQSGGYAPDLIRRQLARVRAISNWRSKVETAYGSQFHTWHRARDRNVRCDVSLGALHCIVEATPCSGKQAGFFF